MTRRASLPGASELFRRTSSPAVGGATRSESTAGAALPPEPQGRAEQTVQHRPTGGQQPQDQVGSGRSGSGRQRHDSKITVYLSGTEVLDLEQARLTLRGTHELPVDRGRIVREAVAVLLEDFDQNGAESVLVQRLRDQEAAEQ